MNREPVFSDRPPVKMFDQAELDRIVQKRVRKAEDSCLRSLEEEFGVDIDTAIAIVRASRGAS